MNGIAQTPTEIQYIQKIYNSIKDIQTANPNGFVLYVTLKNGHGYWGVVASLEIHELPNNAKIGQLVISNPAIKFRMGDKTLKGIPINLLDISHVKIENDSQIIEIYKKNHLL